MKICLSLSKRNEAKVSDVIAKMYMLNSVFDLPYWTTNLLT